MSRAFRVEIEVHGSGWALVTADDADAARAIAEEDWELDDFDVFDVEATGAKEVGEGE